MLSHLRSVLWMCPLIGISVVVMGSISLLTSLFDATGRMQHRVAVLWGRIVLRICMVRVEVSGVENLEADRPYVFCCNHFSLIDTPVMFSSMPREFRVLARQNLWKIPFLGWHLHRAGHIPVHRDSPRAAARNIGEAADKLREGHSILMFPEGGRTRQPVMREFKPGAAYIAIKAQVPIVPMALVGTRKILAPASSHLHPGVAALRVGRPIPTAGLSNRDAQQLIAAVREEVGKLARFSHDVARRSA